MSTEILETSNTFQSADISIDKAYVRSSSLLDIAIELSMNSQVENNISGSAMEDPEFQAITPEFERARRRKVSRNQTHLCPYSGCHKIFSRPSRLQSHLRIHTGEKPFICKSDGCSKVYSRVQHLKRHMELSHSSSIKDQEKTHQCDFNECEAAFITKQGLSKHKERIHGALNYMCLHPGCNERFRKNCQLRRHRNQMHEGISQFYRCEQCQRDFQQKSHLLRHMKMHNGYPCPEEGCDELFYKWSDLRKHRAKVHVSLICNICKKMYSSLSNLRSHRLTHSNKELEAKEPCPIEGCTKSFSNRKSMQQHINCVHSSCTYPCKENGCDVVLASKNAWSRHMQVLHNPNYVKPEKKKKAPKAYKKTLNHAMGIIFGSDIIQKEKDKKDGFVIIENDSIIDHNLVDRSNL